MNKNYIENCEKNKIMLVLLPFWTPQIPPLGISCLKSYLENHGCSVKTVDANVDDSFNSLYNTYFDNLKSYIPEDKRGNFMNIGNDVLRNHLMAHMNFTNHDEYIELIKIIIYKTFYHQVQEEQIEILNRLLDTFYDRLRQYIEVLVVTNKPDVFGLSVYSGNLAPALYAFQIVKEIDPNIKTVMGGGVFADQLKIGSDNFNYIKEHTPYIDKIIVGEGEELFLRYIKGELPENQKVYTLEDINGEVFDLHIAPIPDFSDFNLDAYPNLASYVSRSCPFQCAFCSETVQWGKYRKKSAKQVVKELKKLYQLHHFQLFLMGDSLLNPIVDALSEEIQKLDVPLYWDGYLRADKHVCNIDNTISWRRGGFYRARLGLESGSPNVLNLMGKKITPQQIKDAVSNLATAGIKTTTYWVIGYPGETEEDFQQTLDIIEELSKDIYEAECNPFNYFPSGQVKANEWDNHSKSLVYTEKSKKMLKVQTWMMDCEPCRDVIYDRVRRFVKHCRALGVPNPYSLHDIHIADERWKRLHKNAVPSLLDLKSSGQIINECKDVKKMSKVINMYPDDDEWNF